MLKKFEQKNSKKMTKILKNDEIWRFAKSDLPVVKWIYTFSITFAFNVLLFICMIILFNVRTINMFICMQTLIADAWTTNKY